MVANGSKLAAPGSVQPVQDSLSFEESESQTPHASSDASPPQVPEQSWVQSLTVSESHVPQLSTT